MAGRPCRVKLKTESSPKNKKIVMQFFFFFLTMHKIILAYFQNVKHVGPKTYYWEFRLYLKGKLCLFQMY